MMSQKAFSLTTGVIFLLIAVLHVLRIVFGSEITLDGWTVPIWVSWVPALFFGYFACQGFRLSKKSQ